MEIVLSAFLMWNTPGLSLLMWLPCLSSSRAVLLIFCIKSIPLTFIPVVFHILLFSLLLQPVKIFWDPHPILSDFILVKGPVSLYSRCLSKSWELCDLMPQADLGMAVSFNQCVQAALPSAWSTPPLIHVQLAPHFLQVYAQISVFQWGLPHHSMSSFNPFFQFWHFISLFLLSFCHSTFTHITYILFTYHL